MNLRVFYLTRRGLSDGYSVREVETLAKAVTDAASAMTTAKLKTIDFFIFIYPDSCRAQLLKWLLFDSLCRTGIRSNPSPKYFCLYPQ